MKGFTIKRERQKRNSYFSFANERREQTRLCGFTLIEALVAVTILTLSVVGPLFTASRAIVAAQIARDQLTASYLAQEGIEYVRAMRDNEYLAAYAAGGSTVSQDAWISFLTGGNAASIASCRVTTCTLDPSRSMGTGAGFSLTPCSPTSNSCAPLHLTLLANGAYGYTQQGGVATSFTRTVQVLDVPATDALYHDKRLVSTVSWTFHGSPYSVTITDHLTPWQ